MPKRLVNTITGADRILPTRLARMLVADKTSGWQNPPQTRKHTTTKKSDADSGTETGD